MQNTYEVDISSRVEALPIIKLNEKLAIAFLNLNGNQVLTEHCANVLAEKIGDVDVVVTAESKGIALAHAIAKCLNHDNYVVARKSKKLYMSNALETTVNSITTKGEQKLYMLQSDIAFVKNKRVAIVDDVISTGASLKAIQDLVAKAGGTVIKSLAVLAEGDAATRKDIECLATIPLFSQ